MDKRIEVVDLLLKEGLITSEQLDKAREETKRTGLDLENTLVRLEFISEEDIANTLAHALGVPFIDLSDYLIDAELIKLVPENLVRRYKAVPLFKIGNSLTLAMIDPQDVIALDQIRKACKIDSIEPVLATEKGIQHILDSYYGTSGSVEEVTKSIDKKTMLDGEQRETVEVAEEPPIIKLVNIMIMQAVRDRASDIHIEPEENLLRTRYRIDGILHEVNTLPKKLQSAIISRIKVIANMDIAVSRKPQDGKVSMNLENKDIEIRVSTFPTVHGENVVMRLLDKSSVLLNLKALGISQDIFDDLDKLIRRSNGIILVTGPTGSGKTTTLYAALSSINSMEKNIITVEDPVEYELPLIRQTQVNPKAGITFANGLRSILRQDPDIIMVGEIRDKDTADIAIQAALTGHLVFSTLHTNDAPSTLTRLLDMGVEPFLISSSVIGVLAQRLVRTICDKCKEKYVPTEAVLGDLGMQEQVEFFKGKGCAKCKNIGFLGRIGIFELIIINEDIRKMISERRSADQIKKVAVEQGMKTLRDDGLSKVKEGLTTPDEVLRVTRIE